MVKSVCGIKEGYSKKTEFSTEIILLDAQAGVVGGGTDRGSAVHMPGRRNSSTGHGKSGLYKYFSIA